MTACDVFATLQVVFVFPLNNKGLYHEIDGAFFSSHFAPPPPPRAVDTARQGLNVKMWLNGEDSLHAISAFTNPSQEVKFKGLTDEQLSKLGGLPGNVHTIIASLDQLWKSALFELAKARLLSEESNDLKAMIRFSKFLEQNPNFQNPILEILKTPQWLFNVCPKVPQVFMKLRARSESGSSEKFSFAVSQRGNDGQILLTVKSYDCNESKDSLAALKLIETAMQRVYPNLPEVLKIQFFDKRGKPLTPLQ